ncbi:DCD (Development and Cell Death) domain-like protein [Hibiscus syriacus]|uniref:DCD (Development and Cell Death) domain-like protein n=1 Tax=Hibiscus syriacus TaxID=106335 RepID=A0A6A3B4T2_HIBSY|nr:annexin D8-like [Hibiscus syriacus]KAE8710325.1 DCD (Development and Cell Death) domain-like protein [Hibiscus syriacus]
MATKILASPSHSFENECKEIHESRGRSNQLIRALAGRTQLECRRIRETYKEMYGEDLITLLAKTSHRSVSPKTCAALSLWMLDPYERDAIVAREALLQDDTNYTALVEIFVGRKSSHIALIKQAYHSKYKTNMDQDIINIEPPHPYQKILVALSTSHKAHQADVSQHTAKCDARRLYETGEGSPGAIDEGLVLEIFTKRSIPHLKLTLSFYKHIYGHDYTKSITDGSSGEFKDALKMVVKCICNPTSYYAKVLFASIKGMTADRGAVTRVMVSRSETEMDEIQKVFKAKFGVEPREAICESIPSGDYRDFLLALANKTVVSF